MKCVRIGRSGVIDVDKEWIRYIASCRRRNTCTANSQSQGGSLVCVYVCGQTFHRQDLTRRKCFCGSVS